MEREGRGRKRKGRKAKKENKEHAIESAAGKKHKSSCFSQTRNHSLLFLRLSSAALFLKKKKKLHLLSTREAMPRSSAHSAFVAMLFFFVVLFAFANGAW